MVLYKFTNDYSEGCHPSILEALSDTNLTQQAGYGEDSYTLGASNIIREFINDPKAAIHLVSGGTIANLLVLASILKPFESVIAAYTGHINTHEAGAIEATGHKIETIVTSDGKLNPENIKPLLNKFPLYHTVRPKVVYISNSTEIGTIYYKNELQILYQFCKANNLILFMDGARIASALTAESNNLTLAEIAQFTDVFYIGGTKSGALIGEAIVITNNDIKNDFAYHIKQRGAMLAKGRLLGIQFKTLFKEDLFFTLAKHSNSMASKIRDGFDSLGYKFLTESYTNQIFPIIPHKLIEKLQNKYDFYVWEQLEDNCSAIRIITSWATPEDIVDTFINDLKELSE